MFVIGSNGASGYNLTRSLRFRASASASLSRTMTTPTNNKIWTICAMVKLGAISALSRLMTTNVTVSNLAPATFMYFDSNAQFNFYEWQGGVNNYVMTGAPVFRDPSAWYQIVIAIDTTQATNSNRVKVYFNNTQLTLTASGSGWIPQNTNTGMNSALPQYIGRAYDGGYFDGCMAEFNFIDGQALTPSSFGSTNATTGVWQPAAYTGSYGTNGFELNFTDNSALTTASNVGLGKDFSGNGNYWVTNNISITAGVTYDSMTDVPTLTSATASNFAVLNPLQFLGYSITNGNLNVSVSGAGSGGAGSTIAVNSGKWYFEVTPTAMAASDTMAIGIRNISADAGASGAWNGGVSGSYIYRADGFKRNNGTSGAYGASYTTSDVIGVALDLTAGTLVFYKNNTSQGTAYSSISGTFQFSVATDQSSGTTSGAANFGQRPFTYTAPSGFVALNTYNLPTSTIVKGNTVMDATIYTGTGATLSVTNAASFKPDLVWVKGRSGATDHAWYDSVRGTTKQLESNTTTAETTEATGLTAFGSAGFTVGALAQMNTSAATYVGWQWQAGQGSSSSNTNGTITSTVSVNASAGFSVVTYTGTGGASATVGHGLGVAPSLIIVKERGSNVSGWNAWTVYHSSIGATGNLVLNTTAATNTAVYGWNNTAPTSSVFTIAYSAGAGVNYTSTYVAYCWTPIAGFSAFGSYTGNGSADGPMVYTGFRPKWVMFKISSATGNWFIRDTARDLYNASTSSLFPNLSDAENPSGVSLDILSNGFKLRTSSSGVNGSGETIIYMAYAENPFKNALAR